MSVPHGWSALVGVTAPLGIRTTAFTQSATELKTEPSREYTYLVLDDFTVVVPAPDEKRSHKSPETEDGMEEADPRSRSLRLSFSQPSHNSSTGFICAAGATYGSQEPAVGLAGTATVEPDSTKVGGHFDLVPDLFSRRYGATRDTFLARGIEGVVAVAMEQGRSADIAGEEGRQVPLVLSRSDRSRDRSSLEAGGTRWYECKVLRNATVATGCWSCRGIFLLQR